MISKIWERVQGGPGGPRGAQGGPGAINTPPVPLVMKTIPSQYTTTVKKVQVSVSIPSYTYLDICIRLTYIPN